MESIGQCTPSNFEGGVLSAPERCDEVVLVTSQQAVALMGEQATEAQITQPVAAASYPSVNEQEVSSSNEMETVAKVTRSQFKVVNLSESQLGEKEKKASSRDGDRLRQVNYDVEFNEFGDQVIYLYDDQSNYNDEVDPAVAETVAKLVDTSKVIELEKIDADTLPKRYVYRFAKRAFDIISCSIALLICAIPMAAIAFRIKKDSPGPVFYKQERLGLNGKPITIVKFRSMYVDAEERGAQWALGDDPRVTPIGKKIRANRMDELPQFLSVIKGDLSLIGPRPERAVFNSEFEKYIHGFSQRMMVRPGITGLAQVNGGYDLLPEEKIVYDLDYIKNCSFSMDWGLIWKTISVLFSHEGAR